MGFGGGENGSRSFEFELMAICQNPQQNARVFTIKACDDSL